MLSRPAACRFSLCFALLALGGCRQIAVQQDIPVVQRVWCTPSRPAPGQQVAFHARIINRSNNEIAAGTKFRVAFAIDGSFVGYIDSTSPDVIPSGLFDLSSDDKETGANVTWQATLGRHFAVAVLAKPGEDFDVSDIIQQSRNAGLVTVGSTPTDIKVKIMALGDSVTGGSKSSSSYRYFLSKQLRSDGYNDISFVGSLHGVTDAVSQPAGTWDRDHEGHPGWTAGDIVDGSQDRRAWSCGKLTGSGG